MNWIDPSAMVGSLVSLEPLRAEHSDELLAAADSPDIFRWTGSVISDRADADKYIAVAQADPRRHAFLQRNIATGAACGTTSYYQIDEANRSVAVGYTWLSVSAHGTGINAESKLLLLQRAFDEAHAVRVEWHTDEFNAHSRAAIAKLGASFEGLLRKHRRRVDGSWRTTALFAMTDDDWPAAKKSLQGRVAEVQHSR